MLTAYPERDKMLPFLFGALYLQSPGTTPLAYATSLEPIILALMGKGHGVMRNLQATFSLRLRIGIL